MKVDEQSIGQARALYLGKDHGVLATISVKLAGYPFGSVIPYCPDEKGRPIILISHIAQHTHNLLADPRASVTILENGGANVQTEGRITLVGKITPLPETETLAQERYYRYFAEARTYHQAHNFAFFRMEPVQIRYIGGFGKIFWVEPDDFLQANPFWGQSEAGILQHMNEDHQKNLRQYCQHYHQRTVAETERVEMVGIDAEGFDVLLQERKLRFSFSQPIQTAQEARMALVEMAKIAATT